MSSPASTAAGRRRAAAGAKRAGAAPARSQPVAPPRRAPKARPAPRPRAKPRPRGRLRGGSLRRRAAIVVVAAAALAIGYFGWLRDSSLVAVKTVTVTGLGGAHAGTAVTALESAARGMTTLDVDEARLDAVAARFPEIVSVSADAHFPNGMTIDVVERPPALLARDGRRVVPVAADGTLLVDDQVGDRSKLPTLPVHPLPASGRLAGQPLREALVLGATPAPLRGQVSGVSFSDAAGVTVTLRGGIDVRFGGATAAAAKWAAAAAVLADPRLTTLDYVDVAVPKRPAVG
jgi:cell division protein FtsQ